MKRTLSILLFALLSISLSFAGGKKEADASVLTVGATPEPHAEMLKIVADDLKSQGITLKIVEFTDYVTPNVSVESGEIDANFFQHIPYMNSFNEERNYHLVNAGGIHIEPIALYSKKVTSLSQIADGSTIAIPNDPTNEGRALLLLQSAGLITLKNEAGLTATPLDIVSNSKKLKFVEIEAASLPRVLSDVDLAVINGNYAIPAGLVATRDGLFIEGKDSPYVNIISVKAGNENNEKIVALVKALQSEKVKTWVQNRYPNGEVVIAF